MVSRLCLLNPPGVPPAFSEGLIEDIETDKRVALKSLMRPAYQKFAQDKYFVTPVREAPP